MHGDHGDHPFMCNCVITKRATEGLLSCVSFLMMYKIKSDMVTPRALCMDHLLSLPHPPLPCLPPRKTLLWILNYPTLPSKIALVNLNIPYKINRAYLFTRKQFFKSQ